MGNQLDIFNGSIQMEIGIQKALDHANEVEPSWSEIAYSFLVKYAKSHRLFMIEEVREASVGEVPSPPSARAWGGIVRSAAKSGLIRRGGYKSVSNPKAHCTPATVWIVN